jgi:hypothetical protein
MSTKLRKVLNGENLTNIQITDLGSIKLNVKDHYTGASFLVGGWVFLYIVSS